MSAFTPIEPVRVLHGHTSPDTAYLNDDYPYGGLRCKIRYWLDTCQRGQHKGELRFMSQTTNPKKPGEYWNKPKPHRTDTYDPFKIMYLDNDVHVHAFGIGVYFSPVGDARARLMGIYDQLTNDERRRYDTLISISQRSDTQRWTEFDETIADLAEHLHDTGTFPAFTNDVWDSPRRRWIVRDYERPVYFTLVHQRATGA